MEIHCAGLRCFTSLLLFFPLSFFVKTPAYALYFPQSNLTLRLPYLNGEKRSSVQVLELRTLQNDSSLAESANYYVSGVREIPASVDPRTKGLHLDSFPKDGESGKTATIVVLAKENSTGSNEAVLEIKVEPVHVQGKRINCSDYIQDMCFWKTSRYRIYENQAVTMIGVFGPTAYADVCSSFRITRYELVNGTDYFHVVDNKLFANASLDRDTDGTGGFGGPGPRISLEVRCVVWEETTGIQYAPSQVLDVDILDQDDNPPTVQGNTSVAITLRDFTVGDRLDDNNLILKDADEQSSNRYSVRILGDTHNVFNVTFDTLPIELPKKIAYTAIFTRIYSRTTLLPKSPYRVLLQIRDETLLPGRGQDTLNITLTFYGPEHRMTTTTVSSISTWQPFSYPSSLKVARISARYTRLARPSTEPHPSVTFSLQGSDAFKVTEKGGIIYVADQTLLQSESSSVVMLKLRWTAGDGASSTKILKANLINVLPSKIEACNSTETSNQSCANAETREDCETRCGVASGSFSKGIFGQRCVWRWNKKSNVSQMSEHYRTCSPDLTYCPDNKCDDLERLDHRICPQDCTVESEVHFAHMNKNGRGIKSGVGTCSCNDMVQCTCNVDRFRTVNDNGGGSGKISREATGKLRNRDKDLVVPDARKVAYSGACGPTCMIGVLGASFFVLIVIVGSFVTWRYRMASKGARRECKRRVEGDSNGIGILPSDYVDRGDGLLIGLDTFAAAAAATTAAANRHLLPKAYPPDPKWEFPRSRLTIEQVLGEGEFGRVLRAKAIDIGGSSGATTVAVKTLKENACASELADLLSEYQLLKEAQHPNVIRLLGACTTSGGPVYLIIEFAEFGSLRNYLRRSRHLDSESRTTCSSSLLSCSTNKIGDELRCLETTSGYNVTPRDILSFAWQISKGMAYLADIKLVHRDLAARNVLLATGKVCKISDFGLTRDVYEDDAYLKRSKGRVPVKWMAPESLADHVYTSKSDVWSFGVLLWELVTLGASPYPGVDVHNLYNLLKAGYRMERPHNCSQQLYKLMVSCWHQEPAMRPSFKELTCQWERMLEDAVEYLDLNPRTVHNQAYFASLHALDSPNVTGNDVTDNGTRGTVRTNIVNYLGKPSPDTVTKCDKVDKLHTLWQEPIASFPEESTKLAYVNDRSPPSLIANHYESPIKLRNASITSNSENDLNASTSERPQSYMDMEGKKTTETEDLLVFGSMEPGNDDNDKAN